ncbi:CCN family member 2-like isoform X2 [Macrobrachium rosenbergii]|uniref:CCN family member 2-like isoform X2 n=1 Tax=Macrobrachium rosenbergii TaxID=79674 RepID=UPI0034D6E83E
MAVFRLVAVLVTWCWVAAGVVGMAGGQRAPCYQCEMYKEAHPHSHPYTAVRAHCVYPCNCGPIPSCGPGTPIIQDGCGCCWQCARQAGETCDGVTLCDSSRSLTCRYNSTADATGVCQVFEAKCAVNDTIYEHGETFSLDCRTQCTCQNGTYACVSLCPGETLLPSEQCLNPHLVSVPGQCCREWMCDTAPNKIVGPPECDRQSGRWSECSSKSCGVGVSVRWSTDNDQCRPVNQTRLCQVRACQKQGQTEDLTLSPKTEKPTRKHHIRRGHTCKATLRHMQSVRLRAGWCISEKRYRPKMCADCPGRCCKIFTSTTITVAFLCPLHANKDLVAATRPRQSPTSQEDFDGNDIYSRDVDVYDDDANEDDYPQSPSEDDVLKYPQPGKNYKDFGAGYEYQGNAKYLKRIKKNTNYAEDQNTYPNDLLDEDDYYPADPNRSDNLLEDAPPFDIDNLTVDDDIEFNQIKNDNYETVHHQVEWILRCKCQDACEGEQQALEPKDTNPSAPT